MVVLSTNLGGENYFYRSYEVDEVWLMDELLEGSPICLLVGFTGTFYPIVGSYHQWYNFWTKINTDNLLHASEYFSKGYSLEEASLLRLLIIHEFLTEIQGEIYE